MSRPAVAWYPARLLPAAVEACGPPLEDALARAYALGVRGIEVHQALLPSRLPEVARLIRRRLERHDLRVPMLLCAPDLTNPDPQVRQDHVHQTQALISLARVLGASAVRVTVGPAHLDVTREDGLAWAVESLRRLAEAGDRAGLKLALENHYRDPLWHAEDLAADAEAFLWVLRELHDTAVVVSFNTGNPLIMAQDPLALLQAVSDRLWHVQVADRFPGHAGQTVLGEGLVDLDAVSGWLARQDFAGTISFEDRNPAGDAGTERSIRSLRELIAKWWR